MTDTHEKKGVEWLFYWDFSRKGRRVPLNPGGNQAGGVATDAIDDKLRKAQPIQRLGTPEEIGKVVLFLLSDDCPFMTGALASADGGYTCQ